MRMSAPLALLSRRAAARAATAGSLPGADGAGRPAERAARVVWPMSKGWDSHQAA